MKISLTLPFITKSNNKLLRLHYRQRMKLKDQYSWEMFVILNQSEVPHKDMMAEGRRKANIVSYRQRLMDDDNFIGGLKLLIDCLVEFGLLKDDSKEWLELSAEQRIDSGNNRTEIVLEDV